tara:strand:- start:798 stop:1811 length:1014 start_codon:yes stop_codon:yes gene_type:complete
MKVINHADIIVCPKCNGKIKENFDHLKCNDCNKNYSVDHGVPLLFIQNEWQISKNDVTDTVKSFYEKAPFPNYEELENIGDLIHKAQKGAFARLLNEQIPFNIKVLEVGCGTGQLSNFLASAHRFVIGTDMCVNSLKLGQKFKMENSINRVNFYQMNLFRPIFREESFPLVICIGVLHHTSDPFEGFRSISKLVKKNGYIIIGLYNKYGRIITDMRRVFFHIFNDKLKSLDPFLRESSRGQLKKFARFEDQYKHPKESKHTISEVADWFKETGFDFVYGIPSPLAFEGFKLDDKIFKPGKLGNRFDHFMSQAWQVFTGSSEGGFFLMVGRKGDNGKR